MFVLSGRFSPPFGVIMSPRPPKKQPFPFEDISFSATSPQYTWKQVADAWGKEPFPHTCCFISPSTTRLETNRRRIRGRNPSRVYVVSPISRFVVFLARALFFNHSLIVCAHIWHCLPMFSHVFCVTCLNFSIAPMFYSIGVSCCFIPVPFTLSSSETLYLHGPWRKYIIPLHTSMIFQYSPSPCSSDTGVMKCWWVLVLIWARFGNPFPIIRSILLRTEDWPKCNIANVSLSSPTT